MKKYHIKMEGSYGYPGGEFHHSDVVLEEQLESVVKEYLMPYIESWKTEEEDIEELFIKIKEV